MDFYPHLLLFAIIKRFKLSKNIWALGFVSFFNDMASEMIYPLIPLFLTGVLGAPVAIIGLIEGIAESTASLLKVFSGYFSDKTGKRKPFAVAGYSLSAASKLLLLLAFHWPMVLCARFADRFGKGIRSSARDALIAESCDATTRGKAFGFHRAMDTMGAVIGPLLALAALHYANNNYRLIFALALIPSCIGVILLIKYVREMDGGSDQKVPFRFRWKELDPAFKIYLAVSFLFALGNSSDAFLILRAQDLGLSASLVVIVYVLFNLSYAVLSPLTGILSDRKGSKIILLGSFFLFSAIYLSFGLVQTSWALWILFPTYGLYMAMSEGVGKAYIANLVPSEKRGTAFGIYQTAVGLCTFFASLIAGLLWTALGPAGPFFFGAACAGAAAVLFIFLGKRRVQI